jgi:broad specificity phosphatase PhoE
MLQPTVIHFVRHGEVFNPGQIYYGRSPRFGLSPTGLLQAEKTAQALEPLNISLIFSSPLLRARQTAQVIHSIIGGKAVKISTLLNEVYSPFDGYLQKDMAARKWDIYTGSQPPYEQPIDVLNRVKIFIQKIGRSYPGQQVLAVTHGDVIFFMALWANGHAVTLENKKKLQIFGTPDHYPSHASITKLTIHGNLIEVSVQPVLQEHTD